MGLRVVYECFIQVYRLYNWYFSESSGITPIYIWSSNDHPRGVVGKRLNGGKLSNSGNLLKFLIPSCSWKTISGWTNYSGKVTSQKMSENEMDNRGSKSVILNNIIVKEQRVDGSYTGNSVLRYTLMGFERNYQLKILSKQLIETKFLYFKILFELYRFLVLNWSNRCIRFIFYNNR